jgi:Family of unknown function (DUF6263)
MTIRPACIRVAVILGLLPQMVLWSPLVQAQIKLEFKFPEGQSLTYKTTSRTRQLLTLMGGMEKVSVLRETKLSTRSVGKCRDDSSLPIEETNQFLRAEYTVPDGIKLTLDSSEPNIKIDNPQLAFLADVFKLENSIAYTVVLDKQKKVKEIEGTEKLKEMAEQLADSIAREEFQRANSVDRLRTKFEQALRILPDVPAHAGESWERTELLEINGKTLTVRKKYEYVGTEKKGDKILEKIGQKLLDVKYDTDANEKLPLKVAKSSLKIQSSEGTILFDREEGHIASASQKVQFKGNMTFSGAGVDQTGEFDLTFDTNTQLQPPAQ